MCENTFSNMYYNYTLTIPLVSSFSFFFVLFLEEDNGIGNTEISDISTGRFCTGGKCKLKEARFSLRAS